MKALISLRTILPSIRQSIDSMNNATIDFYRGWMIEVTKAESGYSYLCCSPVGEHLGGAAPYWQEFDAQQAAIKLIDRAFACHALKQFLRDLYEQKQLSFEEWQPLSQSLSLTARALS